MQSTDYSPAPRRIGRLRRRMEPSSPTPPVVPLVLVAASYDSNTATVTLTFDRAIDVDGIDGEAIVVSDNVLTGMQYTATGGVTVLSPTSIRIGLSEAGEATSTGETLTATADNGIVATDDGGAWPGVDDLGLPFSS